MGSRTKKKGKGGTRGSASTAVAKLADKNPHLALPHKATLAYAASRLPGGKETFMEYARQAAPYDEKVADLVNAWDNLSNRDKKAKSLDEVCHAADVDPGSALGAVVEIAFKYNHHIAQFVAAVHQPEIIEAAVKSASRPYAEGSFKDRKMLLEAAGFFPSKGGGLSLNVFNQVAAHAHSEVSKDENEERGLPDFESSVVDVTDFLRVDEEDEEE